MTTQTLELPEIVAPAPAPACPIAAFREACDAAACVEVVADALADTRQKLEEIRVKLLTCDDEAEASKLAKSLGEAETKNRVQEIRASRLEAAWSFAQSLIRPAIENAAAQVGEAAGDSYDTAVSILEAIEAPETLTRRSTNSFENVRLSASREAIAGSCLASGPANLLEYDLQNARRGYPFISAAEHCRTSITAIDRALQALPVIREQARRLSSAHAALTAALK